jgi:hypothetical protein
VPSSSLGIKKKKKVNKKSKTKQKILTYIQECAWHWWLTSVSLTTGGSNHEHHSSKSARGK